MVIVSYEEPDQSWKPLIRKKIDQRMNKDLDPSSNRSVTLGILAERFRRENFMTQLLLYNTTVKRYTW